MKSFAGMALVALGLAHWLFGPRWYAWGHHTWWSHTLSLALVAGGVALVSTALRER